MNSVMVRSPLDNVENAQFAWNRFRRMLRGWALVSVLSAAGAVAWFFNQFGLVSIHFYIAAALGIGAMIMMTGALMSLLFLSSGTGHDDAVRDFERRDDQVG
ncbi:hypothetical protein [Novosphingobium sp.]|uniref:hypothetical protein n=1 Tax=Novosphingobium sp. TaxID=1874826 RepID=UPI0025D4046A|nr:hypothetical protein [Novosphingobium sp.]